MTKIQWAQNEDGSSGQTWNPIVGCSQVSSGCKFCYASKDSPHRFASKYERDGVIVIRGTAKKPGLTWVPGARVKKRKGRVVLKHHSDGTMIVSLGKGAQWTGELRCLPWVLEKPLKRKKPTTYFVNSLSDIFHESLVDCEEGRRFIAAIFGVMAACPQHRFQLLTKRPAKAREWFAWLDEVTLGHPRLLFQYLDDLAWERSDIVIAQLQGNTGRRISWPLPNVWIGTSVEDQRAADERIPELLCVPAALRFLSVEPLLGPVDLDGLAWWADMSDGVISLRTGIDWVIVGGESGPKARPCEVGWIRSVVEQCKAAEVPCFAKQLGSHVRSDEAFPFSPSVDGRVHLDSSKGGDMTEWPEDLRVQEMPCPP